VNEEMNRDNTGDADGMNLEVGSKDEVMHVLFLLSLQGVQLFTIQHSKKN